MMDVPHDRLVAVSVPAHMPEPAVRVLFGNIVQPRPVGLQVLKK